MRFINKKMVVVVLLIIEFTCCYLMYQSRKKEVDLVKVTYEEETNNNMFAMYVENEDTGEYDEVTNTNTFPEGYILNMDKTGCIDNKGNSISDILTSKDDKVMVKSNKTVFCYLYFDKDNRVFAQVKRDYKNSNGALLLSETESDEYPVYYYNGNITNNNILYANFCWKMVRTTETGGVKLIYNGVPDKSEDGTLTCDNTGTESQIGEVKFNLSANSPAYVGYMYNMVYEYSSDTITPPTNVVQISNNVSWYSYYYGDTATWDGSKYVLSNSDGSDVTAYLLSENYNKLAGYYTCMSTTEISCSTIYYVTSATMWRLSYYELSNNATIADYKIKLATSISDNGDGTYTLINPINVIKADYAKNYEKYINYYYCDDLTSETCYDMNYSFLTNVDSLTGANLANNYVYGNSFTYENGTYKLVDIKKFWDWHLNYNQINNYHYTCFNTSGECTNIKYIYATNNTTANYITLSYGKSIEKAINEMLYAEDVNKTDSVIKDYIDTWYESEILDRNDNTGKLYSKYLENAIFCSNREMINSNINGWNPNGGNTSVAMRFNTNSLECKNVTDQFTLKAEAGGTEGYGNNALDYPIALISDKEYSLAGLKDSYMELAPTFSPNYFDSWLANVSSNVTYNRSVRPVVSLSSNVNIISGDGSVTLPYQVELSN